MIYSDTNDEPQFVQNSNYFDDTSLIKKLSTKTNSFNVLSLNCQSINAKIDQLKIKLKQWKNLNCKYSVICLQETWLSDNSDTSLIQIDNYTLISKGKTCSTHGGLLIYLHNTYRYKTISTNIKSDIWEGQFISVTTQQTNNKITIGNIYRPPRDINENYQKFIDEFTKVLTELKGSKGEVVIAGDYNIDLLKIGNRPMIKEYIDSPLDYLNNTAL